jgi:DNA-binding MurR/RpiR family transcriptional regulator
MASGTLADEIRHRLGELSPAERKVGRVLLAGYPAAGFETVAVLADRAGVSGPTVLRFANRLGYHGFPALQSALREELSTRRTVPALPVPQSTRAGERETAAGRWEAQLHRAGETFTASVSRTLAELPPHDLERAVDLLADGGRRVTLAGGRFTHALTQYLGVHLMQLRDGVQLLSDRPAERVPAVSALGRHDVLVVFDYHRYEPEKAVMAELMREHGGRTVLFTDAGLSPATPYADAVLSCQVTSLSTSVCSANSLVPTLAVIETVLASVVEKLGDRVQHGLRHRATTAVRLGLG